MATRSNIAVQQEDGSFLYIYVHNDGYFEGVGQTLLDHYGDIGKARELVALGDLSVVGNEIGEKHDFDEPRWDWAVKVKTPENLARAALVDTWCLAYGRDRGEENIEPKPLASTDVLSAYQNQYLYVMQADDAGIYTWFTVYHRKLTSLEAVIAVEAEDDEDDED